MKPVILLTGRPGVGKTTAIKTIISLLSQDTVGLFANLSQVLSQQHRHADLETEPMYILVSIKLRINASPQFLTPVPTQKMWEAWRERVIDPLTKLLPVVARDEPMTLPVAWQGSPTLKLRTGEDWRQWYLSAIELEAYQEIVIPRHWDDPLEPEESPLAALTDLGGRVREALILFEKNLPLLGLSEEALRLFRKPDKELYWT